MIHSHSKDKDHTAKNIVLERSRKLANTASIIYFFYNAMCLIAYVMVVQLFETKDYKEKV